MPGVNFEDHNLVNFEGSAAVNLKTLGGGVFGVLGGIFCLGEVVLLLGT